MQSGLFVQSSKRKQPQDWQTFLEQVREAGKRQGRAGPGNTPPPGNPDTLKPDKNPDTWAERQCQHVSKAGKRCGNWAMRGANRCHKHGGYRQNPAHPATVRLLRAGVLDRQTMHREARGEVRQAPREARSAARQALRDHGLGPHNGDTLEGIKAFLRDDAGRAWRRWLATLADRQRQAEAKRQGRNAT